MCSFVIESNNFVEHSHIYTQNNNLAHKYIYRRQSVDDDHGFDGLAAILIRRSGADTDSTVWRRYIVKTVLMRYVCL